MKVLINPYPKWLNWNSQLKATLHNHSLKETINEVEYGSDGFIAAAEMITMWEENNYDIAVFTDHNAIGGHPLSVFGKENTPLLMFPGCELSSGPHRQCWFLEYTGSSNVSRDFSEIAQLGGLSIINHPGRNNVNTYNDQWYIDMYLEHRKVLVGLEVYNQGNRYANDRQLWDRINAATIPQGKIVYGYSNPDAHKPEHVFLNYNMMLCNKNIPDLRFAMRNGNSYFCYEPGNSGEAKCPRISKIDVDEASKTITITHDGGDVKWITNGTTEVGTGNTFNYSDIFDTNDFVRAEITNDFGLTGTQPFAFYPEEYTKEYKYTLDEIYIVSNNNYIRSQLFMKLRDSWIPVDKKYMML